MEKYYIALSELGIKNHHLLKIITEYASDSVKDLFAGNLDIFCSDMELIPYRELFSNPSCLSEALNKASAITQENEKNQIHIAIYSKEHYPEKLLNMNNAPAILYYKGADPNIVSKKAIATIGTRHPSKFGYNAVNYLIPHWINENFTIVSGLATGIDRLSHISCLTEGGTTIAVLAHGLDKIYPASNRKLAEDILNNGGTLLSEYPAGTKPANYRFVNRNRLIVGLSDVTVAMECEEKSGSMHTIEFAQQQKRPIFCPDPGTDIFDTKSGLKYILDNKIGFRISDGMDYENVVRAAGYEPEKPSINANYIKQRYLLSLINGIENDALLKDILYSLDISYHSDFSNCMNLFAFLINLPYHTSITISEIIDCFVKKMIQYDNITEKRAE